MRAQFTKYGPKHDYLGAHVCLMYQGRELIGTIIDMRRSEVLGMVICKVRHFCGDPWPIEPSLAALEILERIYEPREDEEPFRNGPDTNF